VTDSKDHRGGLPPACEPQPGLHFDPARFEGTRPTPTARPR
jgi:hypothetical protein